MLRTAPEDHWDAESETGVQYTQEQWQRVDQVRSVLEAQEEHEHVVEGPDDTLEDKLVTAVMALLVSLVTQDISRLSTYGSPLMHFLAVCGVNPTTRTFLPVFSYTPILAQMLWIVRLIMLEIALPLVGWPELGLLSKSDTRSVRKRVDSIRKKHLCEGSYSPTSSILTQLA